MEKWKEAALIVAEVTVKVDVDQARRWFLELKTHPERYRFETHGGFAFIQGDFAEIGARFQTWERFYGLKLALQFELTALGEAHFRFRLVRPPLPLWGAFAMEQISEDETKLRLVVGGTNRLGGWLLQLPFVVGAVGGQIQREVEHIKTSMEEHK